MRYGVALAPEQPVAEIVEDAKRAEDLGYYSVWVNDDRLQKDPFSVLTAIAAATDRITLGPGVVNPYSRHPALIAASIATIDEVSKGRSVLGLGAGGTNHGMLAIDRAQVTATLDVSIEIIRSLLRGDTTTLAGGAISVSDARLDASPGRAEIPIYLGARGPRNLSLAGRQADGVIVGNLAAPRLWARALSHVRAGASAGGRELADLDIVCWLYTSIDPRGDGVASREAVQRMVGTSLVTSRHVLGDLGLEMPARFEARMHAAGWDAAKPDLIEAAESLPRSTIDSLALAGTPDHCRQRLSDLLREVPEISHVVIVPFATADVSRAEVVETFLSDVAGVAA